MPEEPSPSKIVIAVEQTAAQVREAASRLTDRIAKFQRYLSKLKGRVEASVYACHPDTEPEDQFPWLLVKLHRIEKDWLLYYGVQHDPERTEWNPLVEAPLNIKLAAIRVFPDLLLAIKQSQIELIETINKAAADFDDFADDLMIDDLQSDPPPPRVPRIQLPKPKLKEGR